jgi:hypothetical protein
MIESPLVGSAFIKSLATYSSSDDGPTYTCWSFPINISVITILVERIKVGPRHTGGFKRTLVATPPTIVEGQVSPAKYH